jgi:hypothetical protein
MSWNLHIPTSVDEVKALAAAATDAITEKAHEAQEAAIAAKDKALNATANAVDGFITHKPDEK